LVREGEQYHISTQNVFIEKISGKSITNRPILKSLMSVLRSGDKLIVDNISRFAKNTKDLIELVEQLNNKSVVFISLKEALDTTTNTGMFMLTMFGAVAQLEREYIKDTQLEGIAIAVKQKKFKGRKAIEYPKQWGKYYKLIQENKISNADAIKVMALNKTTFYKLVKNYEDK